MFAIGFSFYFFVRLYEKFNLFYLIGFFASCGLLFISKIYVLPAFLPAIFFLLICRKMNIKYQLINFVSILALSAVLVIFSAKIFGYDIISTMSGKQNDFINYISLQEDPGSTYDLTRLSPNIKSFISLIPEGLVNSFFRPFPSEVNSPFMLFSFLEIVMLCFFAVMAIIFFKKPDVATMRFVLFSAMFVLFLYVVVGVYTPNVGSIVRYRTPALPFLVAMLFALVDWEKILKLKVVNRFSKIR